MTFTLPALPYVYDAFEPIIDSRTMEIHHTKHHQAYVDKLNEALSKYKDLQGKKIEELLININSIPEEIRATVRNHGGGHANHSLFWEILGPEKKECEGGILKAIIKKFGSYNEFMTQFANAALTRFGSGWAWLVMTSNGELEIYSTANQDSPYMSGDIPILGLDVWEHAYYLNYQNRRVDYVKAFFNIINWYKVNKFYEKAVREIE
ncbi:MAG: superoxide dismutase [Nanoarchaeota archaeon]